MQHEAKTSMFTLHKAGMVVHVYNLSIWEVESEGSEVQGHFQLHREFETNSVASYRYVPQNPKTGTQVFMRARQEALPLSYIASPRDWLLQDDPSTVYYINHVFLF